VSRHFLDLAEARTLKTQEYQLTQRAVRDVAAHRAMGLIHGDAGHGKTFAVDEAVADLAVRALWLDLPFGTSPKQLVEELFAAVSGARQSGTRAELERLLLEALSRRDVLLIVDEAQRLNYYCVEYLRYLYDLPAARLALVLVGGNGCWQLLRRYPMLRSRIWRRVEFRPLNADQVLRLIPSFHPLYRGVPVTVLREVDDRFAQGNLRNWAAFTKSATELMHEVGERELTPEIVANVFTLHRGLIDAA
jgi:type II secretory pathway predicted ATPase ExeA